MSSFEWMELQTLTSEITAARSRLAAARASKDQARVRALEEEITAAETRRDKLLAHISTDLASDQQPAARAAAMQAAAEAGLPEPAVAEPPAEEGAGKKRRAEPVAAEPVAGESASPESAVEQTAAGKPVAVEPIAPEPVAAATEIQPIATAAASSAPAPKPDSVEGGIMAWDQLTPSDIERAKHEIGVRRAEMLARHAEELKALEGDQAQLEVLEQAIDAFAKKFAKGAVVKLEAERELRQQGGG